MNPAKKYLVIFLFLTNTAMADDTYTFDTLPDVIPGWKVEMDNGDKLLFPLQKETQNYPEYPKPTIARPNNVAPPEQEVMPAETASAANATEATVDLKNFPDTIPGWKVVKEADGSIVLWPLRFETQPKKQDEKQIETKQVVVDKQETNTTKPENKPVLKSEEEGVVYSMEQLPTEIPGWKVINEADGGKILIPQQVPASPVPPVDTHMNQAVKAPQKAQVPQPMPPKPQAAQISQTNQMAETKQITRKRPAVQECYCFDPNAPQEDVWYIEHYPR